MANLLSWSGLLQVQIETDVMSYKTQPLKMFLF